MWCNADVLEFASWLRAHNERVKAAQAQALRARHVHEEAEDAPPGPPPDVPRQVGIYGLDVYSMYESMREVRVVMQLSIKEMRLHITSHAYTRILLFLWRARSSPSWTSATPPWPSA